MVPSPTDALSIEVTLTTADQAWHFDCVELSYEAAIQTMYTLRALLVSDVPEFTFQWRRSAIQPQRWVKITVQSRRYGNLVLQGKIQYIEDSGRFANGKTLIWITAVPECYDLFINCRSGIYLNGSVLDIIQRGLKQRFAQLGYSKTQISQSLIGDETVYPAQKSMTQYGESDLAFIFRNLSEYGIWAHFHQTNNGVTLQLGDHNGALNSAGTVKFLEGVQHEGAGLFNVRMSKMRLTDTVRAIYFDEEQNQYTIKSRSLSEGIGLVDHHCLGNALTATQVDYIADVVKDSLLVQGQVLEASFQGLNLQPGDVIEVPAAGPYVIVAVRYEFAKGDAARSASAQYGLKHQLKACALTDASGKAIPYRTPVWLPQEGGSFARPYPNYDYQGILSGCHGLASGEMVIPDTLGNIPVQFPYNYTEVCSNVPARYTRLISLSNQGGVTGRSFPIYQDTELQVMFADGNMDYPLIKGAAANAATGHVHSSTVQNRSHYALPQGQYLTYSNVPGDHNFVAMGTAHSEGASRSFMMLSNTQDPAQPGMKKLDSQMITSQSFEQVSLGDFHSLQAGNSNVTDQQISQQPMVYLQFIIGDQTNANHPALASMLEDYLQGIGSNLILTMQDGSTREIRGITMRPQGKLYAITQLLSRAADSALPVTVNSITLMLIHTGQNGTDKTVAVNIIAQNQKPVFPTDTVIVTADHWQQNKTQDEAGNIYYQVYLNLLAPAFLFNFRQDHWQLKGEDLSIYQALSPYFRAETYQGVIRSLPFSEDDLNYFATMGNNVTLFIHGYNIGFGAWPVGLQAGSVQGGQSVTLCQDDTYCATAYPQITASELSTLSLTQRYGSDAHKWLLGMEHSLNQAAGFDGKDYSRYERLIGICWQGDPASPLDYSAAAANTLFAAKKTFALIQQLHQKGIKIEIIAHSLGSAVLANILNLCGQAGITIAHAHFWQPAIPDNSLDTEIHDYLKVEIPNLTAKQMVPMKALDYDFIKAQQGAEAITVLFSQNDTILGPTPTAQHLTHSDAFYAMFGGLPMLAYQWIKNVEANNDVWLRTELDPGAGMAFVIPAAVVAMMDKNILPLAGIHEKMMSIYHLANLYRYPASSIFNGNLPMLEAYYDSWREKWKTMQLPGKSGTAAKTVNMKPDPQTKPNLTAQSNLELQMLYISALLPDLFNFTSVLCHICLYPAHIDTQNLGNLMWQPETAVQAQNFGTKLKQALLGAKAATEVTAGLFTTGIYEKLGGIFMEDDCATAIATIILTGLLTPDAIPRGAMGYSGANPTFPRYSFIDQGTLLPDHSGMLFPSKEFFNQIYKRQLAENAEDKGIKYFGKWKPAE